MFGIFVDKGVLVLSSSSSIATSASISPFSFSSSKSSPASSTTKNVINSLSLLSSSLSTTSSNSSSEAKTSDKGEKPPAELKTKFEEEKPETDLNTSKNSLKNLKTKPTSHMRKDDLVYKSLSSSNLNKMNGKDLQPFAKSNLPKSSEITLSHNSLRMNGNMQVLSTRPPPDQQQQQQQRYHLQQHQYQHFNMEVENYEKKFLANFQSNRLSTDSAGNASMSVSSSNMELNRPWTPTLNPQPQQQQQQQQRIYNFENSKYFYTKIFFPQKYEICFYR